MADSHLCLSQQPNIFVAHYLSTNTVPHGYDEQFCLFSPLKKKKKTIEEEEKKRYIISFFVPRLNRTRSSIGVHGSCICIYLNMQHMNMAHTNNITTPANVRGVVGCTQTNSSLQTYTSVKKKLRRLL